MAQIGRQVLLIDADLHRPNVHRVLQLAATPG
jgi:Mrp family chromosome partitioning ATPase